MTAALWNELQEFRRNFDRLVETFFGETSRPRLARPTDWVFVPPVETGWTDERLNLRVILPGVRPEDVEVTAQGNQLIIRGERKAPENFGREDATWFVLPYGKFERVIDLPNGLDLTRVEAHLHDGVLDLRIPVAEAMKPRRIEIAAGTAAKAIAA